MVYLEYEGFAYMNRGTSNYNLELLVFYALYALHNGEKWEVGFSLR